MINESFINSAKRLSVTERREVLARLLAEQTKGEFGTIWKSIRFDKTLRIVAYTPEQEPFVPELKELLQRGALVRIENEADGTCEIYGENRTFYAAVSEKRKFVALLSTWLPTHPPREINLAEIS